jgi:DNA-binding transcriptional LysR family regulator
LAAEAWAAFNAPDPRGLVRLARRKSRALPFLPEAIGRYLAEYPSTENGLSQTAQTALEEVDAGASTPGAAFVRVQEREPRPFMGDGMFYAVLRDLAAGEQPALAGAHPGLSRLPDAEIRECRIWLTEQGRKLLRGRADWCQLSGVARQLGGVALRGARPRWRWNPSENRLMEQRRR